MRLIHGEVKDKGVHVITLLTSRTHDQNCFTISEVAAEWHELIILQQIKWHLLPMLTSHFTDTSRL